MEREAVTSGLPQSGGNLSAIDAVARNGQSGVPRTRWQPKVFPDSVFFARHSGPSFSAGRVFSSIKGSWSQDGYRLSTSGSPAQEGLPRAELACDNLHDAANLSLLAELSMALHTRVLLTRNVLDFQLHFVGIGNFSTN